MNNVAQPSSIALFAVVTELEELLLDVLGRQHSDLLPCEAGDLGAILEELQASCLTDLRDAAVVARRGQIGDLAPELDRVLREVRIEAWRAEAQGR